MAYYANIPLAGDTLSQSQADILNNFIALGDMLTVGSALKLTVAAAPATLANQIALYSKNGAITGVPELFWRQQNSTTERDMTSCLAAANGWTVLPSGIMIQWGTGTTGGAIAFPTPFTTACYSVTATQKIYGGNIRDFVQVDPTGVNSFSAISKDGNGNASTVDIRWIAIGM
jgi:hypothetical protein